MTVRKRSEATRLRRLKADVFGTWAALARAERPGSPDFNMGDNGYPTLDIGPPAPARTFSARAILEDHPRLDIRFLGLPQDTPQGFFMERRLTFGGEAPWTILIGVEPYGPELGIRIYFHHDNVLIEQTVFFATREIGGRRRHMFVCPVLQKPVEVLAYREGLFASAKAQHLVHRSQVGANRKRGPRTRKPTC